MKKRLLLMMFVLCSAGQAWAMEHYEDAPPSYALATAGLRMYEDAVRAGKSAAAPLSVAAPRVGARDRIRPVAAAALAADHAGSWREAAVLRGHEFRKLYGIFSVESVAFNHDGSVLASGAADRTVRLWDMQRYVEKSLLCRYDRCVRSVAFSHDDKILAVGMINCGPNLWDMQALRELNEVPLPNLGALVAFHRDDRILAVGDCTVGDRMRYTIQLWDMHLKILAATLRHREPIHAMAFSPDGSTIVVGIGTDFPNFGPAVAPVWDVATGNIITKFSIDGKNCVQSVACSPEGSELALVCDDDIHLRDVRTKEVVGVLRGIHRCETIAYSGDGNTLAGGYFDGSVFLWDARIRRMLDVRLKAPGIVRSVAFSPDGQHLAFGGDDQSIHLWQSDGGRR